MLRDCEGKELILGQYWDYDGKEWTNLEEGRFTEEHALACAPVDWDGDGDLDLIQGCTSGRILLRRNEGTAQEPAFAVDSESIPLGEKELKTVSGYAMPIVADWDQDGRWDILAGSDDGTVEWFRNTGTAGAPAFDQAVVLVPAYHASNPDRSGTDAQIAVADLNGDGQPDLLVGDNSSRMVEDNLTEEQRARRRAIIGEFEEYQDLMDYLNSEEKQAELSTEDQARLEKLEALMQEYSKLQPRFERHGWVWLYLRAPATLQ